MFPNTCVHKKKQHFPYQHIMDITWYSANHLLILPLKYLQPLACCMLTTQQMSCCLHCCFSFNGCWLKSTCIFTTAKGLASKHTQRTNKYEIRSYKNHSTYNLHKNTRTQSFKNTPSQMNLSVHPSHYLQILKGVFYYML